MLYQKLYQVLQTIQSNQEMDFSTKKLYAESLRTLVKDSVEINAAFAHISPLYIELEQTANFYREKGNNKAFEETNDEITKMVDSIEDNKEISNLLDALRENLSSMDSIASTVGIDLELGDDTIYRNLELSSELFNSMAINGKAYAISRKMEKHLREEGVHITPEIKEDLMGSALEIVKAQDESNMTMTYGFFAGDRSVNSISDKKIEGAKGEIAKAVMNFENKAEEIISNNSRGLSL